MKTIRKTVGALVADSGSLAVLVVVPWANDGDSFVVSAVSASVVVLRRHE